MTTAAGVVDEMYSLGGGSSVYETSPLQRRHRDIHVATQHMLVNPSTWEFAGRVLLGAPVRPSRSRGSISISFSCRAPVVLAAGVGP